MQSMANRVTLARIILIPVFMVVLLSSLPYKNWLAAGTFTLIALSDSLDGYLARSLNQVTDFGKIMDPIADKLVIIAALVLLMRISDLPAWIVIVMISREIIVSAVRMVAVKRGIVISASLLGKAKTVFQVLAIIAWIINTRQNIYLLYALGWLLIISATILSLVSAFDYLLKLKKLWISV